jgi:hypothetical protein
LQLFTTTLPSIDTHADATVERVKKAMMAREALRSVVS